MYIKIEKQEPSKASYAYCRLSHPDEQKPAWKKVEFEGEEFGSITTDWAL